MSLIIAAVLIVGGLVAAVAAVFGAIALFGAIFYDVATSKHEAPELSAEAAADAAWRRSKERAEGRISWERNVARAFVVLGGAFWGVAVFAGLYSYRNSGIAWSLLGAFIPFVATLATLIMGWYFERFTAFLLAVASLGVVYWGVVHQFELGVWMLVTVALIGPMLTASVLFWMARREQVALEIMIASRTEVVPAFASAE